MGIYISQMFFMFFFLIGMFLIFKIDLLKTEKNKVISFTKATAKAKRVQIDAQNTLSKYEKFVIRIKALLKKLGKPKEYVIKLICFCFISGSIIGFYFFRGAFLSIMTGICFTPLSYLYLIFKTQAQTRQELADLENAMSIITNSYLANNNIIKSIEMYLEEKSRYENEFTKKVTHFDEFVIEAVLINSNTDKSLDRLAAKINNHYFDQWVKNLRLCLQNKDMKFSLRPVIDAMADEKIMQVESDTQLVATWRNYLMTVGVMFAVIPALRIAQETWYLTLTQTTVGKGFIALMMITALLTAVYVMRINKPISTT